MLKKSSLVSGNRPDEKVFVTYPPAESNVYQNTRYASFMHQIGLYDNPNCVCGEIQTHQHVLSCQMIGIRGDIRTVDEDFRMWLDDSLLDV